MAFPNTPTGAIQNKVAVKLAAAPALATFANIIAALPQSQVLDNVTAFGPLSLRGNNATWIEFGEGSESSLPAPATPNEFPLTWVITENDALNASLLGANVGDDIFAVLALSADGHAPYQLAVGDDVAYVVKGAVSGVDINFDTPRSCTINIALDGRPVRLAPTS